MDTTELSNTEKLHTAANAVTHAAAHAAAHTAAHAAPHAAAHAAAQAAAHAAAHQVANTAVHAAAHAVKSTTYLMYLNHSTSISCIYLLVVKSTSSVHLGLRYSKKSYLLQQKYLQYSITHSITHSKTHSFTQRYIHLGHTQHFKSNIFYKLICFNVSLKIILVINSCHIH